MKPLKNVISTIIIAAGMLVSGHAMSYSGQVIDINSIKSGEIAWVIVAVFDEGTSSAVGCVANFSPSTPVSNTFFTSQIAIASAAATSGTPVSMACDGSTLTEISPILP